MADDKLNVHQRLAAAMRSVSYVQKDPPAKGMTYSTVSHDAVTKKVRPALLDAGIVYYPVRCEHTHNGNRAECSMTVRFANIDDPTDHFDVPSFGYGVDNQDKGPGKAMSYAVKYALLKAMGLETGDDADNESVDHTREDPAKPIDTAELRDSLLGVIKKADSLAKFESWTGSQAFKDKHVHLFVHDEPKALEVQKAMNERQAALSDGVPSAFGTAAE